MCMEICNGAGAGKCDGAPSTCSSCVYNLNGYQYIITKHYVLECKMQLGIYVKPS